MATKYGKIINAIQAPGNYVQQALSRIGLQRKREKQESSDTALMKEGDSIIRRSMRAILDRSRKPGKRTV